ncbi:MAG: RecX family transcriptional regulator [candidate division WOR-3 bacterium]|nr:RecX family transcriptional regulator [candidate division WOR-3 bacterium]
MQISKIKKGKKRFNIYIDGEFSLAVSEETLHKMDLYEGKELAEEELEKIKHLEENVRAKDYALNLLSYRPRTRKELLRRLKEKKFTLAIAEETVSKLEQSGLVNDYDFAVYFVETFRDRRGIYRLKNDLFRLGVEREVTDRVLADVPVDEKETATNLIDRWLRIHRTRDEKTRRKLINYLVQRGISWSIISDLNDYIKTKVTE